MAGENENDEGNPGLGGGEGEEGQQKPQGLGEEGLGNGDGDKGGEGNDDGANTFGIEPEIYAKLSPSEREEIPNGWRPKAMWNGDDDDFVSAKRFKEKGHLLSEIGKLKSGAKDNEDKFNKRVENLQVFQNAQLVNLRKQLNEQKTVAIKKGDVEAVADIDKQLGDIPKEEKVDKKDEAATDNALLLDWKSDNPWVFDESSEKFKFADNHFKIVFGKGMSMADALELVTKKVAEKYPDKPNDVNKRRQDGTGGDGGGNGGGGGKKAIIPKSQWTNEEQDIADSLEGNFTEEEILQMVTDSREKE